MAKRQQTEAEADEPTQADMDAAVKAHNDEARAEHEAELNEAAELNETAEREIHGVTVTRGE